jgi:hypothetical protein
MYLISSGTRCQKLQSSNARTIRRHDASLIGDFLRYCTVDSCTYEYQRLVSRLIPLTIYTVANEALIGGT